MIFLLSWILKKRWARAMRASFDSGSFVAAIESVSIPTLMIFDTIASGTFPSRQPNILPGETLQNKQN
jgi:hypothetical protein